MRGERRVERRFPPERLGLFERLGLLDRLGLFERLFDRRRVGIVLQKRSR